MTKAVRFRDDRPLAAVTRQDNKEQYPLNFIRMNIGLVDVDGPLPQFCADTSFGLLQGKGTG